MAGNGGWEHTAAQQYAQTQAQYTQTQYAPQGQYAAPAQPVPPMQPAPQPQYAPQAPYVPQGQYVSQEQSVQPQPVPVPQPQYAPQVQQGQYAQPAQYAPQGQFGQQSKPESMAYINKTTREIMDGNPKVKDMAFKLLAEAKKFGDMVVENNLVTTGKTKDGKIITNKFVVHVRPLYTFVTNTGKKILTEGQTHKDANGIKVQNELLYHNDGTVVFSPSIVHNIGATTLTIRAREDMTNGVQFSSIKAEKFDRKSNHMNIAWNEAILTNYTYNAQARNITSKILGMGIIHPTVQRAYFDISKVPEAERTPAMQFAEYAKSIFNASGNTVAMPNGTVKNNCYAVYRPATEKFGETVRLHSNTEKQIMIELSVGRENNPVALAVNFAYKLENNRFASFYINTPNDLNMPELGTVPAEIKQVTAIFKGFN